jgi:predicted permease
MSSAKPSVPQKALRFLRWFCREDYIDEIEGDLIEVFEKEIVSMPGRAGRRFVWRVLRSFRPEFIKTFKHQTTVNPITMFRHNLLITYRNFLRYKSSFFINLVGLSTGLACTMLIYLWVNDELHVDKYFENDDRLYQVMENVDQGGGMITRITTSGPTAAALQSEFPEVEMAVTTTSDWGMEAVASVEDLDISAGLLYAGKDFFRMFSYRLRAGAKGQVLQDKNAIVISAGLARSLFGSWEDAVGRTIELQHEKEYKVTGVFEDLSPRLSTQFEMVLSFELFFDENEWVRNWFNTAPQTFVLMKPDADITEFNKKISELVRTKTEGQANHRTPFVARFSDRYLYGNYENGVQAGGRISYVKLFSIIAVFILLIACVNFMNLSTARATRRAKEVALKKTVGARRSALVVQYLGESTFLAFLSLVIALLAVVLLLPQFNLITDKQLSLELTSDLLIYMGSTVLITGLVAGSYPALYMSTFNPAAVLKGKLGGRSGEVWARRGLVVFQFSLSIILIVSVWVVYRQISFIQSENLGYDRENIIITGRDGKVEGSQETYLDELRKLPGVVAASAFGHDLTGHNGGTYGIVWPGKDPDDRTEFERFAVDYGGIEMLGIEVKEGRSFSKDFGLDTARIIFNEAAIRFMGLDDPIGKTVQLWGRDMEIVGVVKDFHFESFHEVVKPLFFWVEPRNTGNIMVRMEAGQEQEVLSRIEKFYSGFNPGFSFSYRFLDDDYERLYAAEQRVSVLSRYFAALAVVISCLGLFALVSFTVDRRTKEIGIRKVLGSGEFGIVYLLSGEFTKMVLVAIAIALPVSFWITTVWLSTFAFRIELSWWFFAGSGLTALAVAWLTVGLQTLRASRINPALCLRDE